MKVSAVVVTYNRVQLLKKCLKALLNQDSYLSKIFVVNNNSTDGTKEYLKSIRNPNIIAINSNKNLGGAGGFSLGTKEAFLRSNSDYFWIMDDDSMPIHNALSSLIHSARKLHNKFGFLCSNVRWGKDNEPCLANVPKVSFDWNESLNKGLVKLKSATFVSVLIKRSTVSQLGLPIADMFIWGDDTEYTTRISRKYRSYLVANSIVNHNSASNTSNGSIFNVPLNRAVYYKYEFRNLIYISRKYYSLQKTIKLILSDIFTLIRVPFKSKDHRCLRFYYTVNGILKGLLFSPTIKFPK